MEMQVVSYLCVPMQNQDLSLCLTSLILIIQSQHCSVLPAPSAEITVRLHLQSSRYMRMQFWRGDSCRRRYRHQKLHPKYDDIYHLYFIFLAVSANCIPVWEVMQK